jgi:three-Cys-motif partner protein
MRSALLNVDGVKENAVQITSKLPISVGESVNPVNYKFVGKRETNQHITRVEDAPYLPASDGLLARKSGIRAKRKHHFLRNYCGITTKSMRKKWRLVYLDVMAGPGLCKISDTGEEFPGSPFVALDHEFHEFILIESESRLADALKQRVARHPKASQVKVHQENWVDLLKQGQLRFTDDTLVVAFVDPTGISQVPMKAMLQLAKNQRIDLLVTIQHSLGITWNVPQYIKSESERTALDAFLNSADWRKWKWKDPSEFARMAIDAFSQRIQQEGFIGTRHISVPVDQPLYRFTLFSRHPRAEKFWNEILRIDEAGQRELKF